jgi:SAM-dependent methyltransferase
MYDDIVSIYDEIFPLNQAFLTFIRAYLGGKHASVLDLGCGPGDYVHELSQAQYDVTGIDSSAEMIRRAKAGKNGNFFNFSFTELNRIEGDFNCVYSIGNSLSYLARDAMPRFCMDVSKLLRGKGHLLLQLVNWDKFRQTGLSEFPVKKLADGRTFHRRYERAGEATVIFRTELRKDGEVSKSWSDTLYPKYSDSLRHDIEAAALTIVDLFGDYQKSPFDPVSSPATILVAQK